MDHFRDPRNMGEMKDADSIGEKGNPVCGDLMYIYIKVEERDGKEIIVLSKFKDIQNLIIQKVNQKQ